MFETATITQPSMRWISVWMGSCPHTLSHQGHTFRDHFYSLWLEKYRTKVIGYSSHDEESWCSLQSVKLAASTDLVQMLVAVDDRSWLLSVARRQGTWSEWSCFELLLKWKVNLEIPSLLKKIPSPNVSVMPVAQITFNQIASKSTVCDWT